MEFISTQGLPWFLALLAALTIVRAVVIYAKDGRYANVDGMGHAINFNFRWFIAALLLGFAVGTHVSWSWLAGLGVAAVFFAGTFLVRRLIAMVMRPFGWQSLVAGNDRPAGSFRAMDRKAEKKSAENSPRGIDDGPDAVP